MCHVEVQRGRVGKVRFGVGGLGLARVGGEGRTHRAGFGPRGYGDY